MIFLTYDDKQNTKGMNMRDILNKLYLKTESGDTYLETENYIADGNLKPRTELGEFSKRYFELSPAEIYEIQNKITELHCYHEMNFQIKDPNGQYNKVVATPFQGFAPIPFKTVDKLVLSTKKPLNLLRSILQVIYSKKDLVLTDFIEFGLTEKDAKTILDIIKDNIYYEPNTIHESFKDYPFLPVVGFDAAIANINNPSCSFFEYNAGTPCGIEDQYQLFHHLKSLNLEMFKNSKFDKDWDNSHYLLRATIESCADTWTNNLEGICVVISPGPYSPAHPEIAALAIRSKMPLVKMNDLYVDKEGYVRFKTKEGKHPVVKGIYNRREESFFVYSKNKNIPLRSPFYREINGTLAKKFDLELHPGVLYSYLYDSNGKPEAIELNSNGEPVIQNLFDQISPDPETGIQGDLIQAVWEKKFFISNLGGRILDDKRVFRILHNTLKTNDVAHPPAGLTPEELPSRINEAVVKIPDQSGGAGVLIGPCLSSVEKDKILKDVAENSDFYEIQKLEKLAVIPSIQDSNNSLELQTLPVDWRLIVFLDGNGETNWSQHSCLVRTANFGNIKTNTSAGGGYALGMIYDEENQTKKQISPYDCHYFGELRFNDLDFLKQQLNTLFESEDRNLIENITYQFRDLIDLFGLENITWLQRIRAYRDERISLEQIIKESQFILNKN